MFPIASSITFTPYHAPQDPAWTGSCIFFQLTSSHSFPLSSFSTHSGFFSPFNLWSSKVWNSSTWGSLPLDYLILSWLGSSILWKSQHNYPQRGLLWLPKFLRTTLYHFLHIMLFYLFMNSIIIKSYFIYFFMYSLSCSFWECNVVRGGIR